MPSDSRSLWMRATRQRTRVSTTWAGASVQHRRVLAEEFANDLDLSDASGVSSRVCVLRGSTFCEESQRGIEASLCRHFSCAAQVKCSVAILTVCCSADRMISFEALVANERDRNRLEDLLAQICAHGDAQARTVAAAANAPSVSSIICQARTGVSAAHARRSRRGRSLV